jgi:hypothetical protein
MTDWVRDGWLLLPRDARVGRWADAARQAAGAILRDPAQRARWLRHGGTWFAGVDALPNAADGSIGGAPLAGPWERVVARPPSWHRAQLSVVFPGYPRRDPDETDAAHRFRRDRDAAHLDGLLPEGPARRRHLREPHAFILGLPLTGMTAEAAPFVVWEGSHHVIGRAFAAAFGGRDPATWGDVDLTDVYQAARREVFATCPRRIVAAGPGEAILCHRRCIHGTAPWPASQGAAPHPAEGRAVAWFRPLIDDPRNWLAD